MSYFNYVLYMPALNTIKFGRTSSPARRIAEIGRMASKLGETTMRYMTSKSYFGIAKMTETELRNIWKDFAQPGTLEWIIGTESDYERLCAQTVSIQESIAAALGVKHAG